MMSQRPLYNISCPVSGDTVAWLALKIVDDPKFDHHHYCLWHAKTLEALAKMIRDGYDKEASGVEA